MTRPDALTSCRRGVPRGSFFVCLSGFRCRSPASSLVAALVRFVARRYVKSGRAVSFRGNEHREFVTARKAAKVERKRARGTLSGHTDRATAGPLLCGGRATNHGPALSVISTRAPALFD